MASITTRSNGCREIQFTGPDGRRKTIRLGAVPMKLANAVKLRIESLIAFVGNGVPMDGETIQWLGTVSDDLAEKFAAVGLIPSRKGRRLKDFLDSYVAGRANDGSTKGTTRITIERVAADLIDVMGQGADMRNIGPEDAERFKRSYQDRGLAPATTYRRLKMAKMLFGHAVKLKVIAENPFDDVRSKNVNPADRRVYVPAGDIESVIAVAPPFWGTLFALSRFGGMRTPSESLLLRWADVDLAAGRMTIRSPKTEHHEGGASRVCPVFAALRPNLEAARSKSEFVLAGPVADREREHAAGDRGWQKNNLRTTALKMVERAGLTPWPKLFHNLRASCETDLIRDGHPIHVVAAWLGHTPKIALGHYLQTLDSDFAKAIAGARHEARQTEPVSGVRALTAPAVDMLEMQGDSEMREKSNGQGGTRTTANSPTILAFPDGGAVLSAADHDRLTPTERDGAGHDSDPRRTAILAAFDAGDEATRAALYAAVVNHERRAA